MRKSVFWINPKNNRALLLVARSGSTSLFTEICYHQNISLHNHNKHPSCYCGCWSAEEGYWDGYSHKQPEEMAVIVRNPIDRFLSACIKTKKNIDEGLKSIYNDVHFWPISYMNPSNPKYFIFPNEIDDCATWLGINSPVKHLNKNIDKKITPNKEQIKKIKTSYNKDIILWNNLIC